MYNGVMKSIALALVLSLTAGVAAAQAPAPQPPAGPYQATCTDIRVTRDGIVSTLHAVCAPNKRETTIPLPCVGEIINRDGKLVCRPRG
jgi:hypothetical protein